MRLLACIILFAVTMIGLKYLFVGAVNSYGYIVILALFVIIYSAARWYDHREAR